MQENQAQEVLANDVSELNRELAGKYIIKRLIGRGGMGSVYLASDLKLGRNVAIKTLHSTVDLNPINLFRLQMEAHIAANLEHPNIVRVFELIEIQDRSAYVMEYVEGKTLAEVISSRELTDHQLLKIVIKICRAVHYAHAHGIIHRDLKPGNIQITPEGVPKIMDFGVAKSNNTEDAFLNEHEKIAQGIVGSPAFMSPEQAQEKNSGLDNRSDIFSLGGILYCALTGSPPFNGGSVFDTLIRVVNEDPTPPSQINPLVPKQLEAICLKALNKNIEERYQSAGEMALDLHRYIKKLAVSACKYSWLEKARFAIAFRKEFFAVCTLLLVLMFGALAFTSHTLRSTAKESIVDELTEKLTNFAQTSTLLIDPNLVKQVRGKIDYGNEASRLLARILKMIKQRVSRVEFIYIMQRSNDPKYLEFVVEDDTYDSVAELDRNGDGKLEGIEIPVGPGTIFEESLKFPAAFEAFERPSADKDITIADKWDVVLTGYAPIKDKQGNSIAVLGVDMKDDMVRESFSKIDQRYYHSIILALMLTIALFAALLELTIALWEKRIFSYAE